MYNKNRETEPQSTLMKTVGAVADSFSRKKTERLAALEARLQMLGSLVSYLLLAVIAYRLFHIWLEVSNSLDGSSLPDSPGALPAAASTADSAIDSRGSMFYIFGAALVGPAVLFLAYVVLGSIYNVTLSTLSHAIPLLRFAFMPVLLWFALNATNYWQATLKDMMAEGLALVQEHTDRAGSAKLLIQSDKPQEPDQDARY